MNKTVRGHLPNLVIIGAMKCGTTSLHNYLGAHHDVFMSEPKEIDYFTTHYNRGADWYRSHFPEASSIRGESSTSYTMYPTFRDTPKRMHALLPKAKLIYIVRDPIQRTISHYLHEKTRRREMRSLEEALANPEDSVYVTYSLYYQQLSQFLGFYSLEDILVLETEDLRVNTRGTLDTIARFLDIEGAFDEIALWRKYNQTSDRNVKTRLGAWLIRIGIADRFYRSLPPALWRIGKRVTQSREPIHRPALNNEQSGILREFLRSDVEAFRELTGHTFGDWHI